MYAVQIFSKDNRSAWSDRSD